MNRHQVLTGACNSGDQCFAVGSVEGIHFTAYAAGCDIAILASDFQRVQVIPGVTHGNIKVSCVDCSTDTGKIAASYQNKVYIFEPTPLLQHESSHKLDYCWYKTASFTADCFIHCLSWNVDGSKLLLGGDVIQIWQLPHPLPDDDFNQGVHFSLGDVTVPDEEISLVVPTGLTGAKPIADTDQPEWICIWQCKPATPVYHLKFSPDGLLFASAGKNDRVVKIWYEDRKVHLPLSRQESHPSPRKEELHYSFVYISHPRAVTGFSWRKTSKYMPRGSVANMLVTSCKDNVCRIWCETILPDDGLVDLDQFDPVATQDPRYHTRRHKKRFMQRLKTIRHAIHKRKKQHKYGPETVMTSTQLSGTQSVHDFHKFGIHQNGVAPAFHFHLAGSVNPKTDIPLLPTTGNPNDQLFNFQLNWLNNKELQFTTEAEKILQEMHKQSNFSDCGVYVNSSINDGTAVPGVPHPQMRNGVTDDHDTDQEAGSQQDDNSGNKKKKAPKIFRRKHKQINRSVDSSSDTLSNLSCDYADTNETTVHEYGTLSDIVDRKIENLLRDWHQSPDMLFSVHPQDGSFLVWLVEWLDEYTAFCFRQAQVSFSCRIPHAVPILDARTMSSNLLLYCKYSKMDIKSAMKLSESDHNLENGQRSTLLESAAPMGKGSPGQSDNMLIPNVLMISKHLNGSLNLWQISFSETSKFSTVMSMAHISRACGHRFRTNSASCHPVLPLLLTTSHHNIPEADTPDEDEKNGRAKNCDGNKDDDDATNKGNPGGFEFCSELILWKVDPVGPLSKSGGIVELARINSPEISAFSNVSWLPTLLPSNTLGGYSNSPSALFVASDGHSLRMYQAVIDSRLMLTESGPPKKCWTESLSSSVETGGEEEEVNRCHASDIFNIVSLQSTAHPGCIIQLESIVDAKQDWQETQLLHVFQEQLLTGRVPIDSSLENLEAFVDLRNLTSFEEHFYLVLLEKAKSGGSTLHMWKITISSHSGNSERPPSVFEPPVKEVTTINSFDDNDNQPDDDDDDDNYYSKNLNSVKISYSTAKVCAQQLPLPENVEVICAVTAAGHLSSASIYPACLAPYLIVTACSDKSVYFWRCEMESIEPFGSIGGMDPLDDYLSTSITSYEMSIDDQRIFTKPTYSTQVKNMSLTTRYQWQEWTMMNRHKKSSSISIPGKPITVCCAYSGRLAVAYRFGGIRATSEQPNNVSVNLCVAIYECESTGGSEWSLEDTIELNNISIPDPKAEIDLNLILSPENTNLPVFRIGEDSSMSPSASLAMSRTKSVPSLSTIHSVRKSIAEYGNKTGILVQKHLVQLDWVSTEDGSHILTVGVGSKILMYAQVSDEIAQISMGSKNMSVRKQRSSHQKRMQRAKSIVVDNYEEVIRWMKLRSVELTTADGLPPLPMHMSWVRSGILVVAMDNEVHVYSQWRGTASIDSQGFEEPDCDKRSLSDFSLSALASSSMLSASKSMQNFKSSLSTSSFKQLPVNTLTPVHPKKKELNKRASLTKSESTASLSLITDLGLFEAARQANPVLPQYHPKQLMELLNFGRIKRVRAILSHLVRCIAGSEVYQATYKDEMDAQESKVHSIHRQRAMSIGATTPNEKTGICEETTLDYIEIISIPPLPIYALLAADTDSSIDADVAAASTGTGRPASQDYTDLFNTAVMDSDSDSDVFSNHSGDNKEVSRQRTTSTRSHFMSVSARTPHQMLNVFGPMQCQLLAKHLTHMLLPGLTSLDQMYLLALADTIATTSTDTTTLNTMSATDETAEESDTPVTTNTESMDECGIKFLLAMRFHSYLLRTLPPNQRLSLQKDGLRSHYIVWAFHSEASEELLSLVPSMKKGEPTWNDLKQYGAGWWITNINQLKRTIEKVAKASFQAKKDPMDAAIFYLAMKKKGILWGLFRSVNDKKMSEFFRNNFSEERWRKAALKNAFALLGRQRFLHAAAFFLLGNSLSDAIEVCLDRLNDIQLALVICRLYDTGDLLPESAKKILYTHILGCDESGQSYLPSKAHPDPFLRSIVLWMIKDHDGSLQTLLQTGIGASRRLEEQEEGEKYFTSPSVFNFYNFLRAHPLIIRQNKVSKASEMALITANTSIGVRDKNSAHDDRITPVERRLFFTTAHAHFKNGCPLLALEVISKLPPLVDYEEVIEMESPCKYPQTEVFARRSSLKMPAPPTDLRQNNPFAETADSYDWSTPVQSIGPQHSVDFDWSMPVSSMTTNFDDKLDLNFDLSSERSDNESDCATKGSSRKNSVPAKDADEEYGEDNKVTAVDIMAQQYKFIACLKVMMEELRTLATGFEVDGGQLRYQLYIWLEKEVESLRVLCSYGGTDGAHHSLMDANLDLSQDSDTLSEAGGPRVESRPSLHQIIQADKLNFEAKLSRTARRKQWLKTNQQLLRTLLSYCILQGSGVGGLASVQMELLLLLQELQQERTQQQLLSPLPFPTTLPLLSASIASSKTVIADPIQYLRSLTQDLLHSIVEFSIPPGLNCQTGIVWMMRNLSVALSSSIYQCLCDIDNFGVNQSERSEMGLEGFTSHNISCQASHLMSGINPQRRRLPSSVCEEAVNTSPSKWPGVTSLRVLLARERDEESPRLDVLLCESLVAVYMCLLINGLSTYDVHMLYRLIAHKLDQQAWAALFGGGIRTVIKRNSVLQPKGPVDEASKHRMKVHMKAMGQMRKEERQTYEERFAPPELSMITYFMTKPFSAATTSIIGYDSDTSYSDEDDEAEDENETNDDDIWTSGRPTTLGLSPMQQHNDPNSYSWCLIRYAIVRLVLHNLQNFLPLVSMELQELPVSSPLLHAVLKNLEQWEEVLRGKLELFAGPPDNYIPQLILDVETGIPHTKYEALLKPHNSPFINQHSTLPLKRLWFALVKEEFLKDIFIRYVFRKRKFLDDTEITLNSGDSEGSEKPSALMKVIHREQDIIMAFVINQANPNCLALSTQKEIVELDIGALLTPPAWLSDENEYDIETLTNTTAYGYDESDFVLVQTPFDQLPTTAVSTPGTPMSYNSTVAPVPNMQQYNTAGRGSNVMKGINISGLGSPQFCQFVRDRSRRLLQPIIQRNATGVRRIGAHPHLPHYLTGSTDGSVRMWEWGHHQPLSLLRQPGCFSKVTKALFNAQGNKCCVSDAEGSVCLWQVGIGSNFSKPIMSLQCHNKTTSDFAFVGSCSLIATAGHSSESKNVCLWDTLLPQRNALVHAFTCHEHGSPAIIYAPQHQLLISGGRKGEICLFDMRQRLMRHTFQAHEAPIKCLALDHEERFFVTGSAEGDIKVWSLDVHQLLSSFVGEHSKNTFFRNVGSSSGVTQVMVTQPNHLMSCGVDGSMKIRKLPDRDQIVQTWSG